MLAVAGVVCRTAAASYSWNVTTPAKNATVKNTAVAVDLTLGWGTGDPRPTNIVCSIVDNNNIVYNATGWTNQMFDNTNNPATLSGTFTTGYASLANVSGLIRFENYFNGMPNSTWDVPVTLAP